MKLNAWLLSSLAAVTAVSVVAQTPNPAPPPAVPPPAVAPEPVAEAPAATPAKPAKAKPEKKAKTKKHPKTTAAKPAPAKASSVIVLNPPASAVVKCDVLDVRGQGSFAGEIIGHVKKGDTVTVLEEITLGHVKGHEPAQWSKIAMPTNISVWVSAEFINPDSKAVRVKKVNLRGGPGENYSVIGGLEKGAVIDEIERKSGWIKIAASTNAFAFVASEFLEPQKGEAPPPEAAAPPSPPPTPAPVAQPPPPPPVVVNVPPPAPAPAPAAGLSAPAPTPTSQADQEQAAAHPPAPAPTPSVASPAPAPAPTAAGDETPRTITREGIVRHALNIQSPTAFALHDVKTGIVIDFLQPPPKSKFQTLTGKHVIVTGTEYLDHPVAARSDFAG